MLVSDIINGTLLLCINDLDFDSDFDNYKFTKGKKYKLYKSNKLGNRIRDDFGNFTILFSKTVAISGDVRVKVFQIDVDRTDDILVFKNTIGHIFTTDNSLEDYECRTDAKKFGL